MTSKNAKFGRDEKTRNKLVRIQFFLSVRMCKCEMHLKSNYPHLTSADFSTTKVSFISNLYLWYFAALVFRHPLIFPGTRKAIASAYYHLKFKTINFHIALNTEAKLCFATLAPTEYWRRNRLNINDCKSFLDTKKTTDYKFTETQLILVHLYANQNS